LVETCFQVQPLSRDGDQHIHRHSDPDLGLHRVLAGASLPIDKSVCDPKPKSSCKAERNPFNVGHNDLANYNNAKARARACAFLHAVIILISKFLDEVSVEAPAARTGVRQV
jgi:hypothetical protein